MNIQTLFKAAVAVAPLLLFPCVAFAQATGALSPRDESTFPTKEEPPPGGCMPIGVTASGDTVFPYACKDFIEAHKTVGSKIPVTAHEKEPSTVEQPPVANPAAPPVTNASAPPTTNTAKTEASTPAVEQKAAVEQKVVAEPDEPSSAAREAASRQRERLKKGRQVSSGGAPPGCAHFRTYDSGTGMYRDFNGLPRRCTTAK